MIRRLLLPGLAALAAGAGAAGANEASTWYVYCEGDAGGSHWAVFSENFWPHPLVDGYGRQVASAAEAFFETRHDLQLAGCAGVNFIDHTLAQHSRERTAQLHKQLGDSVYFFPLPTEVLPEDAPVVPASLHPAPDAGRSVPVVEEETADSGEPEAWRPRVAPQ